VIYQSSKIAENVAAKERKEHKKVQASEQVKTDPQDVSDINFIDSFSYENEIELRKNRVTKRDQKGNNLQAMLCR